MMNKARYSMFIRYKKYKCSNKKVNEALAPLSSCRKNGTNYSRGEMISGYKLQLVFAPKYTFI